MVVTVPQLTIVVVFIGVLVSYLTLRKGGIKDLKQETRDNAILTTKLDYIQQGVTSIQVKQVSQDGKFDSFSERLIRVEELVKINQKRIDDIDYIKRKDVS